MKQLVIMTALMAEAVPLVNLYRMKKQAKQTGFHLFRSIVEEKLSVDLVVVGMGAQKTREGISAYLEDRKFGSDVAWLNLGIAGTQGKHLGTLIWATSIGEVSIATPLDKTSPFKVCSMQEAGTNYRKAVLFDMEAEAWIACLAEKLMLFLPDHTFCAKVISDNEEYPVARMDKQWVTELVQKNTAALHEGILNISKTII